MAGINVSMNKSDLVMQCPITYPMTWHSSFSSPVSIASSILAVISNLLLMPLIIIFNLLVLVLMVKEPSLRKERIIVLAYLSAADLLTGLVSQPLFIASQIFHLQNTEPNCSLESAFVLSLALFSVVSFHHVVLVTYERYMSIIHPYKYPLHITTSRLTYTSITIWIINTVYLISSTTLLISLEFELRLIVISVLDLIFYGLGFFVMLLFFIYCYSKIFSVIRQQQRQVNIHLEVKPSSQFDSQNTQSTVPSKTGASRKLVWTGAFLFYSFFLTSIPLVVIIAAILYLGSNIRSSLFFTLQPLAMTVMFSNSLLNPIIYFVRTDEFKTHFRRLLGIQDNAEILPNNSRQAFEVKPLSLATPCAHSNHNKTSETE